MRVRASSMTMQRVHPDVAFGVPLRLLRAADERVQFRKEPVDDAEVEREREADATGGPAAGAASRSRPRCARPAGRRAGSAAQIARVSSVERAARSAPRTGPRAARAGCRRRTCADRRRAARAALEVARGRRTDPRTSPVSGSHAIALMVKSRRRAASSTDIAGSPSTAKPLWPRPALRLAPRQRHVDRRRPCRRGSSRRPARRARTARAAPAAGSADAEDLEVEVLRRRRRAAGRAPSRRRRARARRARRPLRRWRAASGRGSDDMRPDRDPGTLRAPIGHGQPRVDCRLSSSPGGVSSRAPVRHRRFSSCGSPRGRAATRSSPVRQPRRRPSGPGAERAPREHPAAHLSAARTPRRISRSTAAG